MKNFNIIIFNIYMKSQTPLKGGEKERVLLPFSSLFLLLFVYD